MLIKSQIQKKSLAIKKNNAWEYIKRNKTLYYMLTPAITLMLIFNFLPMIGIIIAFQDFNIVEGILKSKIIGFENFINMFSSEEFYRIFKNSISFSLLRLFWSFPFPILLAVLLNEMGNLRYKKFSQTVLYLPHFVSWVVISGIIINILSPDVGLVNYIFVNWLGKESVAFLQKPELFRGIVISAGIWKEAGWGTIIYLAAMTGIDQDLYEAARIDGAGRINRIRYITIPCILPTIIVLLILNTGNLMRNGFEQIFLLYSPSVYSVADVFETYTYRLGIQGGKFSYTSAIGIFQSVVGLIMIKITNFIANKSGERGIY